MTGGGLWDITWDGLRLVAVGLDGMVYASADGVTWTESDAGTDKSLFSVAWTGSRFVAVGEDGVRAESSDGVTWTLRDSGTENDLLRVRFAGDRLIVLGESGTVLRESCAAKSGRQSRVSGFR
jgi:hypothetical protein